ncbi:MAG: hypothetical protein WB586_23320 [Chthoniobacterales bacterium]
MVTYAFCSSFLLAAHSEIVTIAVSILALLVSGVSLGWNIYRDVILKARLRVRFMVSQLILPEGSVTAPFLGLNVVNMGPGEAIINMAMLKRRPSRWFGKAALAGVVHNLKDRYCAQLPAKMAVSETITITFPTDENCLLDTPPLRIGVQDSFGRIHWAPKRDLTKAHHDWEEYKAGRRPASVPPSKEDADSR